MCASYSSRPQSFSKINNLLFPIRFLVSYLITKRILKKAIIKIKDENIKSINSLNRVVSKNIYSPINYPTGDNAAFDGYAVNSIDTKNIKKNELSLLILSRFITAPSQVIDLAPVLINAKISNYIIARLLGSLIPYLIIINMV